MRTRLVAALSALAVLMTLALALRARRGRRAAPSLRPRLRPARRGPLLPDRRRPGARPELRRRPARRGRLPPAHGRRAVPDHRNAARVRRHEGRSRGRRDGVDVERLVLRPARLCSARADRAGLRPLVRRAGLAHARLRARLASLRRPALRGPRRAAPARALVDQGVARPDALGATGTSYGGGLTLTLAMLRNRIVLPTGALAP